MVLNGNKKGNCTAFQIIARDDYQITLIQDFPCNNCYELRWRERYYQENTEQCVNKNTPILTAAEARHRRNQRCKVHNAANKEHIAAYAKAYREANREKLNKKNRAYYERKHAATTDPQDV